VAPFVEVQVVVVVAPAPAAGGNRILMVLRVERVGVVRSSGRERRVGALIRFGQFSCRVFGKPLRARIFATY
jgi:hypothetical protein